MRVIDGMHEENETWKRRWCRLTLIARAAGGAGFSPPISRDVLNGEERLWEIQLRSEPFEISMGEEANWFHPASNIEKMHSDMPLTEEDRWPWLSASSAQHRCSECMTASAAFC